MSSGQRFRQLPAERLLGNRRLAAISAELDGPVPGAVRVPGSPPDQFVGAVLTPARSTAPGAWDGKIPAAAAKETGQMSDITPLTS